MRAMSMVNFILTRERYATLACGVRCAVCAVKDVFRSMEILPDLLRPSESAKESDKYIAQQVVHGSQ